MLSWLPSNFKRKAKSRWKSLRIAISRKSRGFSKRQLVQMLQQLGVKPGDTLLVHSSLDQFTAFLEENNGNLNALITHLNALTNRLRGGGPATSTH